MNSILSKLADLISGDGPEVVRVRLSPRHAPKAVIYELSDGTEETLELDGTKEEIEAMFIETKRFWERFEKLKDM